MNTQITLDHLADLKLHGMARAYQAVLSMPVQEQPSINQFIARLAEAEIQDRTHKRTEKFLLQSKLRYNAVLEQVHCNADRNLSQEKLLMLAIAVLLSVPRTFLLPELPVAARVPGLCHRTAGMLIRVTYVVLRNKPFSRKDIQLKARRLIYKAFKSN
jgi:hypothetical protein